MPTRRRVIDELLNGVDWAHGGPTAPVRGRTPLTRQLLRESRQAVHESEEGKAVVWAGLVLSCLVHPEFLLDTQK